MRSLHDPVPMSMVLFELERAERGLSVVAIMNSVCLPQAQPALINSNCTGLNFDVSWDMLGLMTDPFSRPL